MLGLQDYMHYILSVQSDPMLVTFTLAAIDMHLLRQVPLDARVRRAGGARASRGVAVLGALGDLGVGQAAGDALDAGRAAR